MNTKYLKLLAICGLAFAGSPVAAQSSPWTQRVQSLVRENFTYPRSAQLRGDEGRAVVKVDLTASGGITSVTLTKSTGSEILDREAVRIMYKIKQFPAPPRGTTNVSIPVKWQLN